MKVEGAEAPASWRRRAKARVSSREDLIRIFAHTGIGRFSCGSEEGSYLRFIDSCITQLKAQGPSRNYNESKEEIFLQAGVWVGYPDSRGFRE